MKKQLLPQHLLNVCLTTLLSISMILISNNVFSQQADTSLLKLLDMDMEKVLELQQGGRGDAGGFGHRLGDEESKIAIHGYTTNEYVDQEGTKGRNKFDNHYFNVFISGQIGKKLFAEIQLEYEHAGTELGARYAQVDYKLHDLLVIRTGKFLVPISTFNEYLYPEYINKTWNRPYANYDIIPVAWAETGVQLRGQYKMKDITPYYAIYMVNGLEGPEGGKIRNMRDNADEANHPNKAVGGKIGFTYKGLEVSGGAYNGKYTKDGKLNLYIGAADVIYKGKALSVRGEYALANMEKWVIADSTKSMIDRHATSITAAYIIKKRFEPVVRHELLNYGSTDESKTKSRLTVGLNYLITNTANIKLSYEIITNKVKEVDDNRIAIQMAIGF
ncbi:MAG: hypothetical protein AABZ32_02025 [Bacteroidota bacterium]